MVVPMAVLVAVLVVSMVVLAELGLITACMTGVIDDNRHGKLVGLRNLLNRFPISGRASQSGNRRAKRKPRSPRPSLISDRGVPPNADKHPLATTFLTAPSAQRYHKKLIPHSKIALQA